MHTSVGAILRLLHLLILYTVLEILHCIVLPFVFFKLNGSKIMSESKGYEKCSSNFNEMNLSD
jgi:hypothetical protein